MSRKPIRIVKYPGTFVSHPGFRSQEAALAYGLRCQRDYADELVGEAASAAAIRALKEHRATVAAGRAA